MSRKREDAIYDAFCEIVPYTKASIEVQVEDSEDAYGTFVVIYWNNTKSSKYYYTY